MSKTPDLTPLPKAKAEFKTWYMAEYYTNEGWPTIPALVRLPFIFKTGVYLAFLRSYGFLLEPYSNYGQALHYVDIFKVRADGHDRLYKLGKPTPEEALISAIEAAFQKLETELP